MSYTTINPDKNLHYREAEIEPIDYNIANGLGFCEGNIVKYVTRWKHKGGLADLEKAQDYLNALIATVDKPEPEEEIKPPAAGFVKLWEVKPGMFVPAGTYVYKGYVWAPIEQAKGLWKEYGEDH